MSRGWLVLLGLRYVSLTPSVGLSKYVVITRLRTRGGDVPGFAFALPVVSGRKEFDRKTLEEIAGPRLAEHEAAMREAGISRHAAWHQQTPDGTLAVVYMEARDEAALGHFTASDEPFNTWFREAMKEVHGVDISQPLPPVTKVMDVQLKD